MNILISGLVNVETNLRIKGFPINYFPIDFPFFGIHSNVAGVAYNVAKALKTLGDDVSLISYIGDDSEGERIVGALKKAGISDEHISHTLKETPTSITLFDETGRRQIYCDLKDIQDKVLNIDSDLECFKNSDIVVACNINFNRSLLHTAKAAGKIIATDVHTISDIEDDFNREFMECADILFFSDEKLPCEPEEFMDKLQVKYKCRLMVAGLGSKGAVLFDCDNNKKYRISAIPNDNVVNTVGAGDALFSAFLHFYSKGCSPVEALNKAQIFASKKISFSGATLGFCTEAEIDEAYLRIQKAEQ